MKPFRVFHLVYYGYEGAVIDSQVVAPMLRLKEEGIEIEPVFLEDPWPWVLGRWRPKKAALKALGLNGHFLPRVPRNFLNLNTRRLAGLFGRFLDQGPTVIVHARGFQGAEALLDLKRKRPNLRLICDARGIESAEYELTREAAHGRPGLKRAERCWKQALERIERDAVRESDVVFCVSRAMIEFLKSRSGRCDNRFAYIPCALEVDQFSSAQRRREETRQELRLGHGPAIVYAGSMSAWQVPHLSVAVAARFLNAEPNGTVLILTPEPEAFTRLAAKQGIASERLRCFQARHQDVPRYLAAADIGLLLREENDVNRYACPVKFAEYLACGLHVLASSAVEEVVSTIRFTGCGTIIEHLADAAAIDSAIAQTLAAAKDVATRSSISTAAARNHFDWQMHLPTMKKWYFQLASADPS